MKTPKRRFLSFIFACLCPSKSEERTQMGSWASPLKVSSQGLFPPRPSCKLSLAPGFSSHVFRPFYLPLAPTICPWVSEDDTDLTIITNDYYNFSLFIHGLAWQLNIQFSLYFLYLGAFLNCIFKYLAIFSFSFLFRMLCCCCYFCFSVLLTPHPAVRIPTRCFRKTRKEQEQVQLHPVWNFVKCPAGIRKKTYLAAFVLLRVLKRSYWLCNLPDWSSARSQFYKLSTLLENVNNFFLSNYITCQAITKRIGWIYFKQMFIHRELPMTFRWLSKSDEWLRMPLLLLMTILT